MSSKRLNMLEILRRLPRTNCRECRLPSCLAFANQLALGQREPTDCPYLDPTGLDLDDRVGPAAPDGTDQEETLLELREAIRPVDLEAIADDVGGRMQGAELAVRCLGRDFLVDATGGLRSQCHANFWVLIPLLDYLVHASAADASGRAREPTGEWIKFDELGQGLSRSDYFSQTCEGGLRRLLDEHPDLFPELFDLFAAEPSASRFDADLAVVLRPLPKVPLLVCYWKADGPFASKLSIYFDRATPGHLSLEATIICVMGIVEMLKRFVTRHSFAIDSRGNA